MGTEFTSCQIIFASFFNVIEPSSSANVHFTTYSSVVEIVTINSKHRQRTRTDKNVVFMVAKIGSSFELFSKSERVIVTWTLAEAA